MRLVTFNKGETDSIGALEPKSEIITDFSKAVPELPTTMLGLIELGQSGLNQAAKAIKTAGDQALLDLSEVTLKAPIPQPRRDIMAVGRNYHEHAQEFHNSGFDATSGTNAVPEDPIIFTKATTSVSGPFDPIPSYLDKTGNSLSANLA